MDAFPHPPNELLTLASARYFLHICTTAHSFPFSHSVPLFTATVPRNLQSCLLYSRFHIACCFCNLRLLVETLCLASVEVYLRTFTRMTYRNREEQLDDRYTLLRTFAFCLATIGPCSLLLFKDFLLCRLTRGTPPIGKFVVCRGVPCPDLDSKPESPSDCRSCMCRESSLSELRLCLLRIGRAEMLLHSNDCTGIFPPTCRFWRMRLRSVCTRIRIVACSDNFPG